MSETNRLPWLDALRLTAGLSMVGLHASSDPSGMPFVEWPPEDRILPMLFRAVVYSARTELFMVISLFLLLLSLERRPRTYGATIRDQARRLLIPFVVWTLFYLVFNKLKASAFGYPHDILAIMSSAKELADFLILGEVKYHMHFLPTLFGLVLFYPLFRLAVRLPVLGLGVLVCLIVKRETDIVLWTELAGHPVLPYLVRLVKIFTYVGYGMVAGSCVAIWNSVSAPRREVWLLPIAYFGGLLFVLKLLATVRVISVGEWQHTYAPGFWADFLMPVVLFLFCLCCGHRKWPESLSRLAPYSFGIYLVHPIFLDLSEIALRGVEIAPIFYVLLKVLIAVPASAALVFGLSRVSLFAWTVGLGALPFRGVKQLKTVASA